MYYYILCIYYIYYIYITYITYIIYRYYMIHYIIYIHIILVTITIMYSHSNTIMYISNYHLYKIYHNNDNSNHVT